MGFSSEFLSDSFLAGEGGGTTELFDAKGEFNFFFLSSWWWDIYDHTLSFTNQEYRGFIIGLAGSATKLWGLSYFRRSISISSPLLHYLSSFPFWYSALKQHNLKSFIKINQQEILWISCSLSPDDTT
jgi:hypothetical protein